MAKEELILDRLDHLEAQIAPLVQATKDIKELKEDMTPLINKGVQKLIIGLQDIENSVQLEDLLELGKELMRSTRYVLFSLKQLQNMVDFLTTVEPLLRSSVPQLINYLDELEQKGVLRIMKSMLDVRAKVAASYTPEDVEEIGDGFVSMIGLAKKMGDRQTIEFLEKFLSLPENVDFSKAKDCGPFGLIATCSTKEVKQGLGVLMELTKAMGALKKPGNGAPSEEQPENT